MRKFIIQIILLLGVTVGGIYFGLNNNSVSNISIGNFLNPPAPQQTKLAVGNTTINIEIADNDSERTKGLSGRDSLASDSGMLFVFPDLAKHSFWMKDMKFALDFIWINNDSVVDLLSNIPPPPPGEQDQNLPVYQPVTLVNKVLEVNAGFISSHSIRIGDKVELVR